MKNHRPTVEEIFFLIIFLIGFGVRFYNLGGMALSDAEAVHTLRAYQPNQMTEFSPLISQQPAYLAVTGLLFAIFGSSNFAARLYPALAGTLLVLLPYLLSRRENKAVLAVPTALILSLGLALDPGLVIASRTVGSPMAAISFFLLALCMIYSRQAILAGILTALALLSGSTIIPGAIMLGIAWGVTGWFSKRKVTKDDQPIDDQDENQPAPALQSQFAGFKWSAYWIALLIAILIVGTSFFRNLSSLAAWVNTLPVYLTGWTVSSGIPAQLLVAALVLYQPLAILFALLGLPRNLSHPARGQERILLVFNLTWIAAGLAVVLVYPSRQVMDILWIIVPIWTLAAGELVHYLPKRPISPVSIILAIAITLLASLLGYVLASLTRVTYGSFDANARIIVAGGIFVLATLTTILISLGWSWHVARNGLIWGVIISLVMFSFSAMTRASHLEQFRAVELWNQVPQPAKPDLLLETIHDLSLKSTGGPKSIDIVSEVSSPALRWLLRAYPNVQFLDFVGDDFLPSLKITPKLEAVPSSTELYRGQGFTWWVRPGWTTSIPTPFIRWLAFRDSPILQDEIIIWARSDLFPSENAAEQLDTDPTVP